MNRKKRTLQLTALLLSLALYACSSGGGGSAGDTGNTGNSGNATAMVVAEKVTVVDARLSGSVAAVSPLRIGAFRVTAADLAALSDYKIDKTQVWVSERSAESFSIINQILCMIAQTKYDSMLNQGNYIALVDITQCNEQSDASSAAQDSQNQSSSANMPVYDLFTVNASRADNSSPQYVKVWIHEKGNPANQDPEKLIFGKLTITESKSATNPYGLFALDFLSYPAVNGVPDTTNWMFKGTLKSERDSAGDILLKFVENDQGSWPGSQQITLNRKADGSTGSGTVFESRTENNMTHTMTYDIAFDTNNFLRRDTANTQVCLDRQQFEESAWRYGLYDSNGKRINRNSGFSINTSSDGTGLHGWVGYWGASLDNNTALTNGQTVYKYDYGTGAATPYTVFAALGKLKKHTKKTMTLGEVRNIPLDYWEQDPNGGTNYRVIWDGTDFNKIAMMPSNCTNNCTWQNISTTPTPTIDVANLPGGDLNFWSQSLGGQVRVPLVNCLYSAGTATSPGITSCDSPANTTPIIFYAEDILYPTDPIPASLACFDNCPNATSPGGIDPNNPFVTDIMSSPSQTPTNYTFDIPSMTLQLNGNPAVLTTTSTVQQWGITSGPLFEPTTSNMSLLACPWNPAETCGWLAWSALDVFYTWETGPNNWNQLTALKNGSGTFLKFEAPLSVKYVHHVAGSPFDGATFMLDYNGFGDLGGIPGKCVDMDTGADADCGAGGPGSPIRWVPAFVIPPVQADGSLTTVSADGGGTPVNYFVKPLEMEQRMKQAPLSACSSLTLNHYSLPDISIWSDPAIGPEPSVTSAPAAIGGILQ